MTVPERRGALIVLEGGETVGKTTQAARLRERLSSRRIEVVATREPGGSPISERVRELLLSGVADGDPAAQAILFAAARAIHVDRLLRPAVQRGAVVVCDRFIDSSRTLQIASGAPQELIETLIAEACGDLVPDLTVVLTLPDDELTRRLRDKGADRGLDSFEAKGSLYHRDVNARFAALSTDGPGTRRFVDASGTIDEVADRVWAMVALTIPDILSNRDGD